MPGLLAVNPPRRTARGREKDSLILYIMLTGNATFLPHELMQLNSQAAGIFHQSSGSLTSAMRKAAEHINNVLLERNLSTTGRGQYALAYLAMASVRENQCTLLLSGQTHAVWVSEGKSRHVYEPALSGKGLGSSQSIQTYLSQVELHAHDLIVLCGKFPKDWEADLINERPPASLDAGYRKLTFTKGDLHAALIQAQSGPGVISILRPDLNALHRVPAQPSPEPVKEEPVSPQADFDAGHLHRPFGQGQVRFEEQKQQTEQDGFVFPRSPYLRGEERAAEESSVTEEELDALADFAAHMVQPSAYAIPPQPETTTSLPEEEMAASSTAPIARAFPLSIPRTESHGSKPKAVVVLPDLEETDSALLKSDKPSAHAEAARQMAKAMVGGIRSGRRVNERIGSFFNKFVPRLLPTMSSKKPLVVPTYIMVFIAVVIPVLVVTAASAVYLRFGQSIQYDELYGQALNARAQAEGASEPVRQRDEWQRVLSLLDQADEYRETDESRLLRSEAQAKLDNLMGVVRLEFSPAFAGGLGSSTQISRMAASESDLYMLDAEGGNILHASFSGRSLNLDTTFNCQPGTYAGYQVGTMVDLLALPKVNAIGATVLGIDTNGNLLYCSPGQVPQAIPLPDLPNTNWGRITAFVLDNGNLYVLDATSRAVWVFVGKDSTFIDAPYFYFSNQIPNIDNAIDLAVSGDDLYLLHADGHLSTCTFSRIDATPTRCVDPATYNDPFPAHLGLDIFTQAHFTQIALTNPPNPVVLLLDSEHQSVYRFTPRSLELQNQVSGYTGKANPFQRGLVGAIAVSPNYVLYLAIGNQVYFATNLP